MQKTVLDDCKLVKPKLFSDERGYFFESYNDKFFSGQFGVDVHFVQDNQSYSKKDVLRGLHYQLPPYAQAKLVRVLKGKVLDVVVDIRKSSPSFGEHESVILSEANKKQLFIPGGFAHGFVVLSEETEFFYKCDQYYNKEYERGIRWDDSTLAIDWKVNQKDLIISLKDKMLPSFTEADIPDN